MRFSHTLLADPLVERDIVGSIGLACSTLGVSHARGGIAGAQVRTRRPCHQDSILTVRVYFLGISNLQAGLADVTDPDSLLAGNLGLAVFLWEAHYADEDQPDFYFGLFDLNAWYQVG